MKSAVLAFTEQGRALAARVREFFPDHLWECWPEKDCTAAEFVGRVFPECESMVFVGAAGIAVRLVSPLIRSKDRDPAVLVVDEKGDFVIPILSGHLGGANEMARTLADCLGATPVITTGTDVNGRFAVDDWSRRAGLRAISTREILPVSAAVLKGSPVGFSSDFPVEGPLPEELSTGAGPEVGISVSLDGKAAPYPRTLRLVPRIVFVGAGCRRDTDPGRFEKTVLSCLEAAGVAVEAVRVLASVDLKKNELCMQEFCRKYRLDFQVFSPEQLSGVPGDFPESPLVRRVTGTGNVCERSAILAGGERFLLRKQARDGITVAVAIRNWSCCF